MLREMPTLCRRSHTADCCASPRFQKPTRLWCGYLGTSTVLLGLVLAIAAADARAAAPRGFQHVQLVAASGAGAVDAEVADEVLVTDEADKSPAEPPASNAATADDKTSETPSSTPELGPEASGSSASTDSATSTEASGATQPGNAENAPAADSPARTTPAEEPLSGEMRVLRDRIRRTLAAYYGSWVLNSRDHTPWEVMHAIVAYGVRTQLHQGGPRGKKVSAIGWLCFNGPCKRIPLLSLERGELRVKKGPYVQGHHGQFLAMLAQARLVPTYPIRVGGKQFTVADLIEVEKRTCEPGTELTFKLLSLSHYLSTQDTWTDQRGRTWSISRLIAEEIRQPILRTAACGGTHRLMGLSYAVEKRRKEQLPIDGQFARADKYTRDFRRYAFRLQNRDGSFSTKWFERREAQRDRDRRLKTTGHILEWIVYSSPQDQLDNPRLVRAVNYLNNLLWQGRDHQWEIGPLGHALHALRLYHRRRFEKSHTDQARAELARREKARRAALAARQRDETHAADSPTDETTDDNTTNTAIDDNAASETESSSDRDTSDNGAAEADSFMSQTLPRSSGARASDTDLGSSPDWFNQNSASAADSTGDETTSRHAAPTTHRTDRESHGTGNQLLLILPD